MFHEFIRALTNLEKPSLKPLSSLNVSTDIPDVYKASSYADDLSSLQDDASETPAPFKDKEKPRSTPTELMTNEAWIQWMDDEMAGLHGKPMFELRPSKIDHPRAGLGVFTTESCDTQASRTSWQDVYCAWIKKTQSRSK